MTTEELLNLVTEETIIQIMEEHGAPVWKVEGDGDDLVLIFQTICHHGHSHKLYWYKNTKLFICYSNCGTMDIFTMIQKLQGYAEGDFRSAFIYLANKLGITLKNDRNTIASGLNDSVKSFLKECDTSLNVRRQSKSKFMSDNSEITKFYDPVILNFFEKGIYYKGWINEGISIESMEKYGIRWYEAEKHIIIPHYDVKGRLVGIRRRSLKPEDANNKYMPEMVNNIMYEHPTGLNLYGIYENKDAIMNQEQAVIVEGEKSVLLGDTWYGNTSTVVATCGFKITEWQIQALMKLNVNKVYLAFDKDVELKDMAKYKAYNPELYNDALNYQRRIYTICDKLLENKFKVFIINDKNNLLKLKDSPFDRGKEVFETLRSEATRYRGRGTRLI